VEAGESGGAEMLRTPLEARALRWETPTRGGAAEGRG
jgi:hypothetical protein